MSEVHSTINSRRWRTQRTAFADYFRQVPPMRSSVDGFSRAATPTRSTPPISEAVFAMTSGNKGIHKATARSLCVLAEEALDAANADHSTSQGAIRQNSE